MNQHPLHIQTPVLLSDPISALRQKRVYLKMECYQPSGSFKLRGIGKLCQHYASEGYTHFVSSSGGNAGYTAAYAGRQLGLAVTVFVPKTTHAHYLESIHAMGAKIKVIGHAWDDAHHAAMAFNQKINGAYIPPFDHPLIWEGHSTLIDEIVHQCEKPDVIVVAVGGGGLACGILEGLHRVGWPDVPVLGVETEGAASFAATMQAGELVALDKIDTIATTLGAKRITEKLFNWTKRHSVTPVTVSDKTAVCACHEFMKHHRVLVEPACGAPLSVVYDNLDVIAPYQNIMVIICGGIGMTCDILAEYQSMF